MTQRSVVWKIELEPGLNPYDIQKGAIPLSVGWQHSSLQLWFLCDPDETEKETRWFLFEGTGFPFKVDGLKFIGTALTESGTYVWHVFEKVGL